MAAYAEPGVDLDHVIAMLLVHDVGEIDTGDTIAFAEGGWEERKADELTAVRRIFGLLPEALSICDHQIRILVRAVQPTQRMAFARVQIHADRARLLEGMEVGRVDFGAAFGSDLEAAPALIALLEVQVDMARVE